jgi:SAM-dependent methyltransferase
VSGQWSEQDGVGTADATDARTVARRMWALGDYHRFATSTVWEVGPILVEASGIGPGDRVLDVAAGTGNVAIRAAERGARVTASDLTPENFGAGRREAELRGVELEWKEADAQDLPFEDGEFDVVTSAFGAIFAPDHQAVASEMLRVCRPGGVLGMVNFRPVGTGKSFFEFLARYAPPPPPGASPPLAWGEEDHVRQLVGDRVDSIELRSASYVERIPGGPEGYRDLLTTTFGPVIAIRAALEEEPERLERFDSEVLDFATRSNRGDPGGPAEYPYAYLLVVARKAG